MSNFGTLPESNVNTTDDFFIMRQGSIDVKVKRSAILNLILPVGSTWGVIDPGLTPAAQGLPGTWVLLESDCTIVTADVADLDIGVAKGSNSVVTPLQEHTHVTTLIPTGGHNHTINKGDTGYERIIGPSQGTLPHSTAPATNNLQPAGSHSHNLTASTIGSIAPEVDTRGRRYNVNIWHRTA